MSAPAEVAELLDPATLTEIVETVFVGLFGEERGIVAPGDSAPAALPAVAHVDVHGEWDGRIEVSSSDGLVRLAAATLFDKPFEYVTDADLSDVLGELANVVGGNVKSVMPGPSVMGLPEVTLDDPNQDGQPPGAVGIDLSWSHEPIRITISAQPAGTPSQGEPS
ncbi:chemotaxis protein CheX [uncultured Jatrophihabitans sp.]|uniref:chemotaxis protein CheX n=1 Tax=uncultured Jatrophihabitans sp. TaxID=1610747 RepID=UPI0035CA6AC6